jgi:ribosomal protein L15
MNTSISASQLRRAADIQDKIESLQIELGKLLGDGSAGATVSTASKRKRRKMSAAARAKIAAAQRARWAKVRAAKK